MYMISYDFTMLTVMMTSVYAKLSYDVCNYLNAVDRNDEWMMDDLDSVSLRYDSRISQILNKIEHVHYPQAS